MTPLFTSPVVGEWSLVSAVQNGDWANLHFLRRPARGAQSRWDKRSIKVGYNHVQHVFESGRDGAAAEEHLGLEPVSELVVRLMLGCVDAG